MCAILAVCLVHVDAIPGNKRKNKQITACGGERGCKEGMVIRQTVELTSESQQHPNKRDPTRQSADRHTCMEGSARDQQFNGAQQLHEWVCFVKVGGG